MRSAWSSSSVSPIWRWSSTRFLMRIESYAASWIRTWRNAYSSSIASMRLTSFKYWICASSPLFRLVSRFSTRKSNKRPITDAFCKTCLDVSGRRSIRALSTPRSVFGIETLASSLIAFQWLFSRMICLVSINERINSSMKKGFPFAFSMIKSRIFFGKPFIPRRFVSMASVCSARNGSSEMEIYFPPIFCWIFSIESQPTVVLSGREMQINKIGCVALKSATLSSKFTELSSAQCKSSNTITNGPSTASPHIKPRVASIILWLRASPWKPITTFELSSLSTASIASKNGMSPPGNVQHSHTYPNLWRTSAGESSSCASTDWRMICLHG